MSLLPLHRFPRSLFDVDDWLNVPLSSTLATPTIPTLLDVYDPYDELDYMLARNIPWLSRPEFLTTSQLQPTLSRYRVSVDCSGFSLGSIKTEIKDNKLLIKAHEKFDDKETGDYTLKEFQKSYDLPPNALTDRMVSYMSPGNQLIVEIPLQVAPISSESEMFPKIVDNADGTRSVRMEFKVPQRVDPSKVHISLKDRDLIFRCEETIDKPDEYSKFHIYQVNNFFILLFLSRNYLKFQ
jgi:HSP20 family molecular chaperone IbpA